MKSCVFLAMLLATLPILAQVPDDARKLTEAYEKEQNRAKLAYVQKLDALAAKYRTDSKDAEANAIEAMIAELEGKKQDTKAGPTPEEFLKSLVGVWRRDYDNGVFTITSTTEGAFGGSRKFTISYDRDKQRVALIGDNWIDFLTPSANPDTVNGEPVKGQRYKLKRVK